MNKKQLSLNMVSVIVAFVVSIAINFVTTPILNKALGDEAYGFIGMANDFITYATIISSVFNSVAGRFISFELHRDKVDRASRYFSSLFVVNLILAGLFAVIGIALVGNLEKVVTIPPYLVTDVKLTFGITFLNYILVVLTSVFTVSTYVKNRLDLEGIRNIISYAMKLAVIVFLFTCFDIKLYFLAIATVASTVVLAILNVNLRKKLIPEIKFNIKKFSITMVKRLASSGAWMAISNFSFTLMTGFDLLITNYMIGVKEMGILSAARSIPNTLISLVSTVGVVFTPSFVTLYAQNKIKDLVKEAGFSVRVMGAVLIVPLTGFIVFGHEFYSLWMPYKTPEEIRVLQIISVLTMMQSILNALTFPLAQLSVVTDKLKAPVAASFIIGSSNILIVIGLLKTTHLGLYAVAGISSLLLMIRYLTFNPIYAAKTLKCPWYTFYPPLIRSSLVTAGVMVLFLFLRRFIASDTWLQFGISIVIVGVIGYIFVVLTLLKKDELKNFIEKIKNRQ
ncbi:MAG: oligosaccharide flippase family protein [Lachnospiraceae bacterium]|nr:oligosaccharide flippase family protein [Lachnospiraceae bacterium]